MSLILCFTVRENETTWRNLLHTMAVALVLTYAHQSNHTGRPFPLKGRYMANIFVHFEPVGSLYDPSTDKRHFVADLPPYLIPGKHSTVFVILVLLVAQQQAHVQCPLTQRHFSFLK